MSAATARPITRPPTFGARGIYRRPEHGNHQNHGQHGFDAEPGERIDPFEKARDPELGEDINGVDGAQDPGGEQTADELGNDVRGCAPARNLAGHPHACRHGGVEVGAAHGTQGADQDGQSHAVGQSYDDQAGRVKGSARGCQAGDGARRADAHEEEQERSRDLGNHGIPWVAHLLSAPPTPSGRGA